MKKGESLTIKAAKEGGFSMWVGPTNLRSVSDFDAAVAYMRVYFEPNPTKPKPANANAVPSDMDKTLKALEGMG